MRVLSQRLPDGPLAHSRGAAFPGRDGSRRNLAEGAEVLPPGVNVQWVSKASPRPVVRRLQDAGFVGLAERGPLFEPRLVRDSGELLATFGRFVPWAFLALAAAAFFENDGRNLWLVRVADRENARRARLTLLIAGQPLELVATSEGTWGDGIFAQVSPVAGESFDLVLWLAGSDQIESWPGLPYDARRVARLLNGNGSHRANVRQPSQLVEARVPAKTEALGTEAATGPSNPGVVDDGGQTPGRVHPSLRRRALRRRHQGPLDTRRPGHAWLSGGREGLETLDAEDFRQGLETLAGLPSVSMIAMPDIVRGPTQIPEPLRPPCRHPWPADCDTFVPGRGPGPRLVSLCRGGRPITALPPNEGGAWPTRPISGHSRHPIPQPPILEPAEIEELQVEMIEQCTRLRDRIALLDPPPDLVSPEDAVVWVDSLRRRSGPRGDAPSFAAFYAPWVEMPDPLYPTARSEGRELVVSVPPCGHVAGAMAEIDRQRGPAKPPANIALKAARALSGVPRPADRGVLNEAGVNLILPMPGRGLRLYGARSLALELPWCFLNVRRLMIYVETNLERLLLPLVFENQGPLLWETAERLVGDFSTGSGSRVGWPGRVPSRPIRCAVTRPPTPRTRSSSGAWWSWSASPPPGRWKTSPCSSALPKMGSVC